MKVETLMNKIQHISSQKGNLKIDTHNNFHLLIYSANQVSDAKSQHFRFLIMFYKCKTVKLSTETKMGTMQSSRYF